MIYHIEHTHTLSYSLSLALFARVIMFHNIHTHTLLAFLILSRLYITF